MNLDGNRQLLCFDLLSKQLTAQCKGCKEKNKTKTSAYRLVPSKPHFHYAIQPAVRNKGRTTAQMKRIYRCATKTGRGNAVHGHCPQLMVKQPKYLWKLSSAKYKEPHWWRQRRQRESDRNRGKTRVNTLNGKCSGVVSESVSSLTCFSLPLNQHSV